MLIAEEEEGGGEKEQVHFFWRQRFDTKTGFHKLIFSPNSQNRDVQFFISETRRQGDGDKNVRAKLGPVEWKFAEFFTSHQIAQVTK